MFLIVVRRENKYVFLKILPQLHLAIVNVDCSRVIHLLLKYNVVINEIDKVNEIPGFWTEAKLRDLLAAFGVEGLTDIPAAEVKDYLSMAMSDLEPEESAQIVLRSLFSKDELTDGQVEQISHDMLQDKIVEEYPAIEFHEQLFYANQLLFKGYNGKFPNTFASIIDCTITPLKEGGPKLNEADVIQILSGGLKQHCVIMRLLEDQLSGKEAFPTAPHVLWTFEKKPNHAFQLTTSDYWISEEDFGTHAFEGVSKRYVEEED